MSAISDVPPLSTDVAIASGSLSDRNTTTMAFDYATVSLRSNEILHLYGLPGQESLDFMGDIVGRGAVGALLLLDASSPHLTEDYAYWINALKKIASGVKIVVGVTKVDVVEWFSIQEIRRCAADNGAYSAPVLTVDPRDYLQIIQLVSLLLLTI
jgi:signal recognition particle receptor subunit beta